MASLSVLIMLVSLCVFSSAPVMADGLPSTITTNTSAWPVSKEQAIEIAAACLPSDVTEKAEIEVRPVSSSKDLVAFSGEHARNIWVVIFTGVTITEEKLDWQVSPGTYIYHLNGELSSFEIDINATTGNILFKYAMPPQMSLDSIIIIKYQDKSSLSWYHWVGFIAAGSIFAAGVTYLAVRILRRNMSKIE